MLMPQAGYGNLQTPLLVVADRKVNAAMPESNADTP
jgi:hypothetical protein